ncbi:MAG TPA: protein kinase [Vicinamibacterales bacterium]|nr:protein kinase [Vicinamibacterales bacterium]
MVGQNIGKYRVEDRVGRGGLGTVYRAIDETLHREVAIKVLNAELNDPEIAKRFRAEAITVARLSHPGIATIYELFQHDGQWLMVMEFVRGETLERLVERMGALSPQRAAELCMQSLAALAHAHSMGVVHRDLKPANLMITETGSVKIMDFGIARVAGTEHLTSAGYMMGTPAYMAPEQVMGHEIDARADLYAMGVVFYRLTTSRLPFKADTPFAMAQSQVNDLPTPVGLMRSDLPPWVEQIVARALAKAPELRFQSAVEFHEAFARCLAGLAMTSTAMSAASAPTEVMTTPARPMPTGTISSRFQTTAEASTAYAQQPTMAAPTDPATVRRAAPVPPQPKASFNSAMPVVLGFAVVAVVLAAAGLVWSRFHSQNAPPGETFPAASASGPSAANPPTSAASPDATVAANPPPVTPAPLPAAPGAGRGVAATPATGAPTSRGTTPPPGAPATAGADASGRAAARSSVPATPPPTGVGSTPPAPPSPAPDPRPADPSDSQVVFPDVKVLVITGRRAQDRDALLSFVGGQLTVLNRQGGTIIASTGYKAIERATYVRARNPRWDPALFSPPDNLDMPGILPTARHWLVLQSRTAYLILQLGGNTWPKVLETIENRTGIKVDRSNSGGW